MAPEVAATETRRQLGLNESEPVDVLRMLQHVEGINVARIPFGDDSKVSGLFVRKGKTQLIVINTNRSRGHQAFTASHEYYHLRYSGMTGMVCSAGLFDDQISEERDADEFAACLLMPASGIEHFLQTQFTDSKIDFYKLIRLEQYYGVSHQAMLRRLISLRKLSELEAREYSSGVMAKAREYGLSTELYEQTGDFEVRSTLGYEVARALKAGLISEGRASEYMTSFGLGLVDEGGQTRENELD